MNGIDNCTHSASITFKQLSLRNQAECQHNPIETIQENSQDIPKTYKLNVYSIDSLSMKGFNSVMPLPFRLTITFDLSLHFPLS